MRGSVLWNRLPYCEIVALPVDHDVCFLEEHPAKSILRLVRGAAQRKVWSAVVVDGYASGKVEGIVVHLYVGRGCATSDGKCDRRVIALQLRVCGGIYNVEVSILVID